jgi:DNA-binding PadR family transcriptional regulator
MRGAEDWGFGAWAACCGPGVRGWSRRAGRRRRRFFERGDLKYMILSLLAEKPMHGYEVMQRLESESGGVYSASPGSVYPVLQLLQDQGYVVPEEADGKRVYRITEAGRRFLEENRSRADDVVDRMSDFADRLGAPGMREVTRSFVRLARVSFERAVRAAGDPDALRSVREVLERAAAEIEGLEWSRGAGSA